MEEDNGSVSNSNCDPKFRILNILNTLVHIAMGIVIYIVFLYAIKLITFNTNLQLHIIFSVMGYQFFMLEGILAHAESNSWTFFMHQVTRRKLHSMIQVLAVIFVTVGFILAITAKNDNHFETTHGICGLVAFIFTISSLIHGILSILASKSVIKISEPSIKFAHTLVGNLAIIMGLVTLCLGLNNGLFKNGGAMATATAMSALTLAYVIINPTLSMKGYWNEIRQNR